ncbi:MAG TPA: hypothetical protein HPP77_01825, partial [Candidatus Hydrogenedentes bacterium]|nr:hypothetical protein [Candidatus Hydrogenedentota bacterium]
MRARWLLLINAVILIVAWGRAEEPCVLGNEHVTLRMAPPASGLVAEFALLTTQRNVVAERGLLQEGFGIGSFYVPGRRLNARLRQQDGIEGTHQIRFSYDCDGPNIRGLNVTRAVELVPDATAFRVTWTVENKGSEDHWIAPWVRNDVCPGGAFDPNDRIDLPSFAGIVQPRRSGYFPAARNWIAVTDPVTRETVFGLFHADHTHSFLALRDEGERNLGFQTAFTPRVLEVGDTWTTTYQIGIVRGLTHIDFASDSIVVQIDYEPGKLILLIGAIRPLSDVEMQASVRADDETVWKLPRKRFDVRPGRLARCTYDWAAPRDGAYEFMALLERDGQAFPLGFDSGSPHGGIDTQFVAGGADTIVMDAWTDAPHALDRRPRTLRRALAAPGDTALWIEDPLHKVFREDVPEATGEFVPTARIALARNEYESFQLVVRPPEGRDLDNVTVQVHDLVDHATGNTIPADKVALFRVGYVPVRVPTHFENPTGQWPDPLIPYAPFRAPGGQCAPLWLTVHAPRDTAPGTYTGLIEIAGAGMEPIELWLEATVWNFELPNTASLKTDFGFWLDGALKQCHRRGYTGAAADLAAA